MKLKFLRLFSIVLILPIVIFSQDASDPTAAVQLNMDFLWTLIAAILVFFMQAGFAMLEAGLTRAKNVVNIMMKNLMDFSIGTLVFFLVGFGIMFGTSNGFFGTDGFMLSDYTSDGDPWTLLFWLFQVVFAATAATIVSGAMAERTKFIGYIAYSAVITAIIYPVFGSWAWGSLFHGSGWLEGLGFIDFAGSTVVHSVGGWAALAGTIVLGPRIGKFSSKGKPQAIPGHNMALVALGTFILWFGWFGFNAGSTTAATTDIAGIAVTTNLAAAAGAVAAMITAWMVLGKPEGSMTLNGAIAGLVAITAGCANVSPISAIIIGLIAGVLVVLSILFLEKQFKIDDPVGAVSVHGVCGAWGTLAAGIFDIGGFSLSVVGVQALGVAAAFLWTFPTAFLLFKLINKTIGLRVSREEEIDGLDVGEHGIEAYPEFEKAQY